MVRSVRLDSDFLDLRLVGLYNCELFHFEAGWFPKLRKLTLWNFEALKSIIMEKDAMPDIRELWIGYLIIYNSIFFSYDTV